MGDLADAEKAEADGRWREAITSYTRILEREPHRAEIRVRIAALYARLGAIEASRAHFQEAADAFLHSGEREQARFTFLTGAKALVAEQQFWTRAADLALEASLHTEALRHLLDGGQALLAAKQPALALRLLRRAFSLEPFHPEIGLALGDALIGCGRRSEARMMWLRFAFARRIDVMRRARWALAKHFPTPANLWRALTRS